MQEKINSKPIQIKTILICGLIIVVLGFFIWLGYQHSVEQNQQQQLVKENFEKVRNSFLSAKNSLNEEDLKGIEADLDAAADAYRLKMYDQVKVLSASAQRRLETLLANKSEAKKTPWATITFTYGNVQVQRKDDDFGQKAFFGYQLNSADKITTMETDSAAAIAFAEGSKIILKSNSEAIFAEPTKPDTFAEIFLSTGDMDLDLNSSFILNYDKISIQTEKSIFQAQKEEDFCLKFYKGRISISTPSEKFNISEPTQICFASDGSLVQKYELPALPEPLLPGNLHKFVFSPEETSQVQIVWKTLAGIKKYLLELANDEFFTKNLQKIEADSFSYLIQGLKAGTYYWRVYSIDAENIKSPPSSVWAFEISSDQSLNSLKDTTPPSLKIEHVVVHGDIIDVSGWTETGSIILVGNVQERPDKNGYFRTLFKSFAQGETELAITAVDSAGNKTVLTRRVLVGLEPPAEEY